MNNYDKKTIELIQLMNSFDSVLDWTKNDFKGAITLIDEGADIDAEDKKGWTILMIMSAYITFKETLKNEGLDAVLTYAKETFDTKTYQRIKDTISENNEELGLSESLQGSPMNLGR